VGGNLLRDRNRRVSFLEYWAKVRIPANDAILEAGEAGLGLDLGHGFFCLGLDFDLDLVLVLLLAPSPVLVLVLASFGRIGFGCRLPSIPIADVVLIASGADGLDALQSIFITCDASGESPAALVAMTAAGEAAVRGPDDAGHREAAYLEESVVGDGP
jgi:hypothetical protein